MLTQIGLKRQLFQKKKLYKRVDRDEIKEFKNERNTIDDTYGNSCRS